MIFLKLLPSLVAKMSDHQSKSDKKTKSVDKSIDYIALIGALKAIKINNKSLRETATEFNMSKTSLARYVKKFEEEGKDIAAMTDAELDILVRKNESYGAHRMVF